MTKRRLLFATPFVVVACKAPAPESPRKDEQTREEEAPVVVGIAQPIDAAVAVEPPDLREAVQVGRELELARATRRSDRDRSILGEGNPPPPTIRSSLLESRATSYDDTDVTFDAGTERGVSPKRARARLLDGDTDRPLAGGEIKIDICARDWCRGKVFLRPDVVSRNPNIEIRAARPDEPEVVGPRRPITCCINPPRPPKPPKPPVTANPPAQRTARIISVQPAGDRTKIVIAAGTDQDVTVEHSEVRLGGDKPVRNGDVTLTSCNARTCTGTVRLTPDQIKASSGSVTVRWKD